jgi:hypothetical protein
VWGFIHFGVQAIVAWGVNAKIQNAIINKFVNVYIYTFAMLHHSLGQDSAQRKNEAGEDFSISEQLLRGIVERFRGGLASKAQIFLHHSTLGSRVIKKKREEEDAP